MASANLILSKSIYKIKAMSTNDEAWEDTKYKESASSLRCLESEPLHPFAQIKLSWTIISTNLFPKIYMINDMFHISPCGYVDFAKQLIVSMDHLLS